MLSSDGPELLPAGIYHGADQELTVESIGDLARWAAVASPEAPARRVEGPWGAFAVVDLALAGEMRALLYAPWEGRASPTRAELDLLTLFAARGLMRAMGGEIEIDSRLGAGSEVRLAMPAELAGSEPES